MLVRSLDDSELNDASLYRDVPGFQGYRVGKDGSVWSNRNSRWYPRNCWKRLVPTLSTSGYWTVTLRCGKGQVTSYIHRLVLFAFVGPCPPGMNACHGPDQARTNCQLENLRWDTQKSNCADKIANGTDQKGQRHGRRKLTEDDVKEIRRRASAGVFHRVIAESFDVCENHVSAIVRRIFWNHVP